MRLREPRRRIFARPWLTGPLAGVLGAVNVQSKSLFYSCTVHLVRFALAARSGTCEVSHRPRGRGRVYAPNPVSDSGHGEHPLTPFSTLSNVNHSMLTVILFITSLDALIGTKVQP